MVTTMRNDCGHYQSTTCKLLANCFYSEPLDRIAQFCAAALTTSGRGQSFSDSLLVFDVAQHFKETNMFNLTLESLVEKFPGNQLLTIKLYGSPLISLNQYINSIIQQISQQDLVFRANSSEHVTGSAADKMCAIKSFLESCNSANNKMAIFLIYDCEIFASPKHLSLIYSILDATKHHSTLISTILVSSKCDATEYFEKRLKSRLGKYQINFMPQLSTDTINKCLIEFLDPIFKSKSQKLKSKKKLQSECIKKIIEKLQTLSQFTLFVPFILKISMKLLSSNNKFTEGLITEAYQELIDSFDIKPFISHPQQFLLTAVVRFSHKSPHVSSFTFKMIYDFYCTSLNQGSDMLPNYDEKSFRNIFEQLIDNGAIVSVDSFNTVNNIANSHQKQLSLASVDSSEFLIQSSFVNHLLELTNSSQCPAALQKLLKSSI